MINLPTGTWFTFCGLRNATEQDMQDSLAKAGIQLGLESISVKDGGDAAIISLTKEHLRQLLERALLKEDGKPLTVNGRSLVPNIPRGGR